MGNPALKEAFKWHTVTLYCPENIMFLDKVDRLWRALFIKSNPDPAQTFSVGRHIYSTFFSNEAQWEVSLSRAQSARLQAGVMSADKEVGIAENVFDEAYESVVRDLSRSLTNFQTTAFWRAYSRHTSVIEQMFRSSDGRGSRVRSPSMDGLATTSSSEGPIASRPRADSVERVRSEEAGGDDSSSESLDFEVCTRAELLARVRALYRTTTQVHLRKVPDKEVYQCLVAGKVCGSARLEGETFYFLDRDGKILLNVPHQLLFGTDSKEVAAQRRRGLARRQSSPAKMHLQLQREQQQQKDKAKERRSTAAAPPALVREPSAGLLAGRETRLRRASTNTQLKERGRLRRGSAGSASAVKPTQFHFKAPDGTIVGPLPLADSLQFYKYHVLPQSVECSSDAGITWELLSSAEAFRGAERISSIDPTQIIKGF